MAQAILRALKRGPLSQTEINKLFQRNRSHDQLAGILARLRHAKQITRAEESTKGRPKTVWRLYENEKSTQPPGKRRIYVCLRFPSLAIGNKAKFEAGFLVTDDPQMIRLIEQSAEFGLTVRDVSDVLHGEMPLTDGKRVYFSSDPSLVLRDYGRFHIRFRLLADGLSIYSSDIPDCHRIIEESPLLRIGKIREAPRSILVSL